MKHFFLLLFLTVFFFSCSKNDVEKTTDEPPVDSTAQQPEPPEKDSSQKVTGLPQVYITIDDSGQIRSKEHYVRGDIKIEGEGKYEDYSGRTKIRGRGNTTWSYPKKPYKLKLIDAAPLFGLAPYKKWILLANWRDGSLLINSIPYEMAHLLGMPFANHVIPVELTLNGKYQGLYVFTEHKEVGKNRIDVGTGKNAGVLFELDYLMDEPYTFRSDSFDLPVMLHYPKLDKWEDQAAVSDRFNEIKDHFNRFLDKVADSSFPHNDYLDYFDDMAYVNYLLVYLLTDNEEINQPKSTYINKSKNGKYRMGIIWDFDSGFGYIRGSGFFNINTANDDLFWDSDFYIHNRKGTIFIKRFFEDPHMVSLIKKRWNWFKNNKYALLIKYVKKYAELVKPVYAKDHEKWGKRNSSGDFDTDLSHVINWLDARVDYLDTYISSL